MALMPRCSSPSPPSIDNKRTILGPLRNKSAASSVELLTTIFIATSLDVTWAIGQFDAIVLPNCLLSALRREVVDALERARAGAFTGLPRAAPIEPPAALPGRCVELPGQCPQQTGA